MNLAAGHAAAVRRKNEKSNQTRAEGKQCGSVVSALDKERGDPDSNPHSTIELIRCLTFSQPNLPHGIVAKVKGDWRYQINHPELVPNKPP